MLNAFLALAPVELSFEILDLLLKDGNLLSLFSIDRNDVIDLSHIPYLLAIGLLVKRLFLFV